MEALGETKVGGLCLNQGGSQRGRQMQASGFDWHGQSPNLW